MQWGPRMFNFRTGGAQYEDVLGGAHSYYIRIKAHFLKELIKERKPSSSLSCLDVGCGTADVEKYLQSSDFDIVGVDISNILLSKAKERDLRNFDSIEGDGLKLPFKEQTFDVCFSLSLFHHIDQSKRLKALTEITRVTKPTGLIVTFEHNPYNPVTRFLVKKCVIDENAKLLAPKELRNLYERCGIGKVNEKYVVFFPRYLSPLCFLERYLSDFPIGGQYVIWGTKAAE